MQLAEMKSSLNRINDLVDFFSTKVVWLFAGSLAIGILWFVVESLFIFVIQGFLVALDLIEVEKTFLPEWTPAGPRAAMLGLLIFGVLRSGVFLLKQYLTPYT